MISIRTARKGDIKILQEPHDELFQDNSKYDSDLKKDWALSEAGKKYFIKILNNPKAICLIAEENEKPIGYIVTVPKKMDWRLSKYIEVENMCVLSNYRCQGVGSELMNKCLEIAKKKGFQKAYVASYHNNKKALAFYKKSGFKEIDMGLERGIRNS